MPTSEELKNVVREKYAIIAGQTKEQNESSCCGISGCCGTVDYAVFSEAYEKHEGYVSEADLGLGCGIPTEFAKIKPGDTVLDLGSGAGNDCFVARAIVGEKGKVLGVDFTDQMISKARANADKLGFNNVEFRHGDIEQLPVGGNSIDVVISNCVLNLVPDKAKAFGEIFRVLKPGGHFSVSDIVLSGELPEQIKGAAEMYAGCVSGAIRKETYIKLLEDAGFINIRIEKERAIVIPEEILLSYCSKEELEKFRDKGNGIFSITVYGEKHKSACCTPGGGCC